MAAPHFRRALVAGLALLAATACAAADGPRYAPLGTLVPDVWSPWRRADETRGGFFAGWEKLHGSAADPGLADAPPPVGEVPPIPHPYELRCRAVLSDRLFTPLESEDPNVGKPDPSTATREEGAGAAG